MRLFKIGQISSLLIATAITVPFEGTAQSSVQLLNLYFNDVHVGKYPAIPKSLSLPENAKKTLTDLSPYTTDTLTVIRSKAYTITHIVGDNSRLPHIREEVVARLIHACNDKDAGNVGLALDYLKEYRYEEYTDAAKDSVRALFRKKIAHFDQLIKLAGFLKLTDLTDDIRPLTLPGTPQSLRWAGIVALTRMGDFYFSAESPEARWDSVGAVIS